MASEQGRQRPTPHPRPAAPATPPTVPTSRAGNAAEHLTAATIAALTLAVLIRHTAPGPDSVAWVPITGLAVLTAIVAIACAIGSERKRR